MKLKCPACGAPIPAAAINVQQMVAVCPECDNVFKFDDTFRQKRRKLKAPAQFRIADDPDRLDMAFKWSFRTEAPLALAVIGAGLFLLLLMCIGMLSDAAPAAAFLIPLVPMSYLLYIVLAIVLNSTHYESDGETLAVYSEPLPHFYYGKKLFALDDIDHVTVGRGALSASENSKAGQFTVYVHTLDGDKAQVAMNVNYEHAYFIAQEIEAYVQARREALVLPISDDLVEADDADTLDQLNDLPEAQPRKALRS